MQKRAKERRTVGPNTTGCIRPYGITIERWTLKSKLTNRCSTVSERTHRICRITLARPRYSIHFTRAGRWSCFPNISQFRIFVLSTPWVKKTRHHTLGHNFTNSSNNRPLLSYYYYYQLLSDFQIFFTSELGSKFATNSCLNIPPRFKHVATLPCEIWMSGKLHHSEIHIAINDESQGSITKNLRCDELLYYIFIIHSAGERIFKIGKHLAKLQPTSSPLIHCADIPWGNPDFHLTWFPALTRVSQTTTRSVQPHDCDQLIHKQTQRETNATSVTI